MKEEEQECKKHKWAWDFADCPFCGGEEYQFCKTCGFMRDKNKKPL